MYQINGWDFSIVPDSNPKRLEGKKGRRSHSIQVDFLNQQPADLNLLWQLDEFLKNPLFGLDVGERNRIIDWIRRQI